MNGEQIQQMNRKATGFRGFFKEIKNNRIAYLMTLPGITIIVMFSYIPMVFLPMAFQKYHYSTGLLRSEFVGFKNFEFLTSYGDRIYTVIYNTVILNVLFIILGLIFGMGFAILLDEIKNKTYRKITSSIFFFPYFLSWVVVGSIIYGLLSSDFGSVNTFIKRLGFEPIRWYNSPQYWKGILATTNVWKMTGYGTIIYLAAISGINGSCYEAAMVDGSTRFQRILYITIPLLRPTAVILVLFSIGRIFFGDFGMIYGIIGDVGTLLKTTEVIDSYVFRILRTSYNFSVSTAIGLFQSVLGLITIVTANRIARKINDGVSLF